MKFELVLVALLALPDNPQVWIATGAVVLVGAWAATWLGSFVVGKLIASYAEQLHVALQKQEKSTLQRGFPNGGKAIGKLERFLIYLFVLSDQSTGVGFLVAAKSVFRFGELSEHENRLEAEYITIGTLLSFGWGLGVSIIAKLGLQAVMS